jgi:hypothetical protein
MQGSPGVDAIDVDEVRGTRQQHLLRESCIRLTGLFSLILAVIVILSFGLGTLWELRRINTSEDGGLDPWVVRRWAFRMIVLLALAVLAAVTSWGLYRLKNWARCALTIVTILPIPVHLASWLLLYMTANRTAQENIDPEGLIALSIMSAYSCPTVLFLMWSPKGRTVFFRGYLEVIRQTPDLKPGCSGVMPTIITVPAGFFSYWGLLIAVLIILVMAGLIRSI